ncbi:MAG: hypothetical protein IKB85_02530 [Bacteroidales bacterium]|nr:hypothetical protein [Bacteroidales bacterium]
MKKIFAILVIAAASMVTFSCQKPDSEFLHSDNTISSVLLLPAVSTVSTTISGEINQETGEILFAIPKNLRSSIDITKVKVRATVSYDVVITPSLSGIKDLSEEYPITVTATQTGESKNYTLRAYYSRN